ncbi:DUF4232 domain-containing protein [Promicromonospora thailandica]|uniref:DUF4232 domain-containing protein n=1 Tax=Promicromonospora thailandica TaxID=765201 RepID=A0A9X2G529_9MICO|nr:DUF4232 domain-containing protein [Promicromonospora thailandica]MCP2265865.1 Protein of unknown function (DUF4232) [Promicromonospora thailandica]
MITRQLRSLSSGAALAALLFLTAGCTADTGGDTTGGGTTPSATAPSASSDTGTDAPSGEADSATTDGADSGDGASDGASGASGATDGAGAASESERCLEPDLAGSLAAAPGGGSAGHDQLEIVLTNTGDEDCVLQGWPGVSFVGDGDGTQLGAAAILDRSSAHQPVPLAPGDAAHADLQVAHAENYGDDCHQTPADGLRVYAPGETRSLFVQNDELTLTACASADQELLEVGAFQPGA